MKLAITDHAVDRFIERVRGAERLSRESARDRIRLIVADAVRRDELRQHTADPDQKLCPFLDSEGNVLEICIGRNTTGFPGDFAVISILVGKQKTTPSRPFVEPLAVKLGDKFPQLKELISQPAAPVVVKKPPPVESYKFIMWSKPPKEDVFYIADEKELIETLTKHKLKPEQVTLFRLQEFKLKTVVELE